MRAARLAFGLVLVFLLLGLSGFTGERAATRALPAGAEIAPANSLAFVSLDTDVSSTQWQAALQLADLFPGKAKLFGLVESELAKQQLDFNSDIKPALGSETDIVWFGAVDGKNVVVLTQPANEAKLDALLAKADQPLVQRQIAGWTVFADSSAVLDRFESASAGGSLVSVDSFAEAMNGVSSDALGRAYVNPGPIMKAVVKKIQERSASSYYSDPALPSALSLMSKAPLGKSVGALGMAVVVEQQGVRLELAGTGSPTYTPTEYSPELPGYFPAGAIFYASFAGLDDPLGDGLAMAEKVNPQVAKGISRIETLSNLSLKDDILPLVSGEGGVAVYGGKPSAGVLVVLRPKDAGNAKNVLDRIEALATIAQAHVKDVTVGGLQLKSVGPVIFGFDGGNLIISSSRMVVERLTSSEPRLSDDPLFSETLAASGAPSRLSGLVYLNVDRLLAFKSGDSSVEGDMPKIARDNLALVHALDLYSSQVDSNERTDMFVLIRH